MNPGTPLIHDGRLLLFTAALLLLSGCSQQRYYAVAPPPPPGYGEVPPLVRLAESNGYRLGVDDGARDAYGSGYHPHEDRAFYETPGYDPLLGPLPPYRDAFRGAYMRGYDRSFRHR